MSELDTVFDRHPRAPRSPHMAEVLTYAEQTAARLLHAELRAFDGWTEEEVCTHIRLLEKYTECFRREVEKL